MRLPRLFKGLLISALLVAARAHAQLPATVERALHAVGIPSSSASAIVVPVAGGAPSLRHRPDAVLNPASTMKLVTTYAALELLGPAYRWRTEVYQDGPDLVLRGYGDPKVTYESFWLLLRAVRARGLKDITGDVVLDRTYFGEVDPAPLDDDTFRPYNVVPDALLLNFKSLHFTFLPEGLGVRVFAEPALPGLQLVNSLRVVDGACPEGRAFRDLIRAEFQPRPPRASFTGAYPASCGEKDLNVALHAPEDYVEGMIRQLWSELGGSWRGRVRAGVAGPAARLIYTHESEPLSDIIRDINKFSNNVMARQLYLTLAAETGGAPARPENAFAAIRKLLSQKNIRAPELVMENGSGLSRNERISAGGLAAVLLGAWHSALMPEFVSSLPVVASDGTMKKRLRGEGVAGQAHIKTGLLHDVRSIAGYVLDKNGQRHVVVMLVNHPRAPEAQAALDALLTWVYQQPPTTTRAPAKAHPRASSPRRP